MLSSACGCKQCRIVMIQTRLCYHRSAWLIDRHGSQDMPDPTELKTPAKRGREKDAILGVRLGAGGRSYMVQDKKIGVLRNVHGGVQVGPWFGLGATVRRYPCEYSC